MAKKKAAKKKAKKKAAKAPAKKRKAKGPKATKFQQLAAMAEKSYPGTSAVASAVAANSPDLWLISTGNIGLDIAMYGGLRVGRIHRFVGKEKACKTGSSLNAIAEFQKHCGECFRREPCEHGTISGVDRPKGNALYIDAENKLMGLWTWVKGHGVDLDHLLYQTPPTGQHIVDFADAAIRAEGSGVGIIVVDSIAHVISQEEIKKQTLKGRTAPLNAQLVNQACRKWSAAVNSLGVMEQKKPTIVLINQIRLTMEQFGNPETLPGGLGQGYATSIDVRFSRGKYHYIIPAMKGEKQVGWEDKAAGYSKSGPSWKPGPDAAPDYVEINYRVTNSGVCPPGRYGQFQYWLRANHGRRLGDPDNIGRLWDYVRRYDLMVKGGKGYKLHDLEERTQAALRESFYADPAVQLLVWTDAVKRLL